MLSVSNMSLDWHQWVQEIKIKVSKTALKLKNYLSKNRFIKRGETAEIIQITFYINKCENSHADTKHKEYQI